MDYKYNYVIAGSGGFYDIAYNDLKTLENVLYYKSFTDGINCCFKRILCRLNFNIKLNKYIRTPISRLVYPWLLPNHFDISRPLCYIFFGNQYALINTTYIEYLRKQHPDIKLVLYMQDIVASLPYYDIENYKKRFDIVLSYDKGDCDNYGLKYYPTPYSKYAFKHSYSEDIDVFFCGAGKTRYKTILDTYHNLTSKGLKCIFYITDVPIKDRIDGEGLHYDQPMSYIKNLEYVQRSKCILEVMQDNADGFTPRLWEAIIYNKHLLTNNFTIKTSKYWNPNGIHILNECDTYDFINQSVYYPEDIKKEKSAIQLLHFLES